MKGFLWRLRLRFWSPRTSNPRPIFGLNQIERAKTSSQFEQLFHSILSEIVEVQEDKSRPKDGEFLSLDTIYERMIFYSIFNDEYQVSQTPGEWADLYKIYLGRVKDLFILNKLVSRTWPTVLKFVKGEELTPAELKSLNRMKIECLNRLSLNLKASLKLGLEGKSNLNIPCVPYEICQSYLIPQTPGFSNYELRGRHLEINSYTDIPIARYYSNYFDKLGREGRVEEAGLILTDSNPFRDEAVQVIKDGKDTYGIFYLFNHFLERSEF